LNRISPIVTQDYNFAKLQSFLEENDFANKFGISAN
jgi:hypothetical protein